MNKVKKSYAHALRNIIIHRAWISIVRMQKRDLEA